MREAHRVMPEDHPNRQETEPKARDFGGEGGIRTHVPVTRQDAFEAPPLRPLRYLSVIQFAAGPPVSATLRRGAP
jgi:hypothetical protein